MADDEKVEVPEPDEEVEASPEIMPWQFIDEPPKADEVMLLLKNMPPTFGVKIEDYADHVQALGSKVKVNNVQHNAWTLYVSVAGRVRMGNDIAVLNGWRFDLEPEPVTPTGIPGYLRADDERIVYREYAVFYGFDNNNFLHEYLWGRKPGTAWVPASGGQMAVGTNRYEKVETSARGRALAAWGIGVLPGSGIASLEEMQGAGDNTRAERRALASAPRRPREELLSDVLTKAERVRQARNITEDEQTTRLAEYVKRSFGVDIAAEGYTDDDGKSVVVALDWSKVKDGQLVLVENQLQQTLVSIQAEEGQV